jgi:hypothetical protein
MRQNNDYLKLVQWSENNKIKKNWKDFDELCYKYCPIFLNIKDKTVVTKSKEEEEPEKDTVTDILLDNPFFFL